MNIIEFVHKLAMEIDAMNFLGASMTAGAADQPWLKDALWQIHDSLKNGGEYNFIFEPNERNFSAFPDDEQYLKDVAGDLWDLGFTVDRAKLKWCVYNYLQTLFITRIPVKTIRVTDELLDQFRKANKSGNIAESSAINLLIRLVHPETLINARAGYILEDIYENLLKHDNQADIHNFVCLLDSMNASIKRHGQYQSLAAKA